MCLSILWPRPKGWELSYDPAVADCAVPHMVFPARNPRARCHLQERADVGGTFDLARGTCIPVDSCSESGSGAGVG